MAKKAPTSETTSAVEQALPVAEIPTPDKNAVPPAQNVSSKVKIIFTGAITQEVELERGIPLENALPRGYDKKAYFFRGAKGRLVSLSNGVNEDTTISVSNKVASG
jgi:hypothetical protein